MEKRNIRNFCIIAHIDHGKSTLADRFLEFTNTVSKREMKHGQMLDTMDLEQERGITIKLQPVRMDYNYKGENYILNLIDTPGHVDFSYEVSRSLAACEGAILVVDASQGIEAQTLANCYMAMDLNLTFIPVLNKIDLPSADVEQRSKEIESTLGIERENIISISAKEGINIDSVLDAVVERIPEPSNLLVSGETKALIFDSVYDPYRGVVSYIRVFTGQIKKGDKIFLLHNRNELEALEVGYFRPKFEQADVLMAGEVGYLVSGLKNVSDARVGDTVWMPNDTKKVANDAEPLVGYKEVKQFVFASVFCIDGDSFPLLREALLKLQLSDSALYFEPMQSSALGHGFRCGFLGLLHLDIVQERLEREYNLDLIVTAPSVSYIAVKKNNEEVFLSNPSDLPDASFISEIKEPWVKIEVVTPKEYIGNIMQMSLERRALNKSMQYMDENRVILIFEIPLSSIVIDYFDLLKSLSSGYASMNYEFLEYRSGNLVKLDILISGQKVDALSSIIHKDQSYFIGSSLVKKLKDLIPKAQFEISLQASIGSKIIARESISSLRKDVTAKLYGGDRSRKDKLLQKQKAGKKRMKKMGKINLPQEAFMAILKR